MALEVDEEHQRLDMYHQKVDVGVTASTFNFAKHQKSRGDIMKRIRFIASKKHQSIAFCILMLWKSLQKASIFKVFRTFWATPKPLVLGSSPSAPAKITERMFPLRYFLLKFGCFWLGLEGRVLNDSPGDCQIAPPLRPGVPKNEWNEFLGWMKSGKS